MAINVNDLKLPILLTTTVVLQTYYKIEDPRFFDSEYGGKNRDKNFYVKCK